MRTETPPVPPLFNQTGPREGMRSRPHAPRTNSPTSRLARDRPDRCPKNPLIPMREPQLPRLCKHEDAVERRERSNAFERRKGEVKQSASELVTALWFDSG